MLSGVAYIKNGLENFVMKRSRFWTVVTVIIFTLLASLASATPRQQAYLKSANSDAFDRFGGRVAISGDTIVVAALNEGSSEAGINRSGTNNSLSGSGAAYVFVRQGTNWTQQAYLKPSNPGGGDYFGSDLAISGDTIVVSATYEDSSARGVNGNGNNNSSQNSGAAYIFVRDGTNWSQQAFLKASNAEIEDWFGRTVAISGDTVVVGAIWEDSAATVVDGNQNDNSLQNAGAAYVFVRTGTNWYQQAYLKPSTRSYNFGQDLAISGETVAVGADEEVFVFTRSGTQWSQQAVLSSADESGFGYSSLSLSEDTLVVGASLDSRNAVGEIDGRSQYSGAVYVFVRNGTDWNQQAYFQGSNTEANHAFGACVEVSGDLIVVGSFGEPSNATGVNGNQNDDSAPNAGAAYVFGRTGGIWTQHAYLKASNTRGTNYFYQVAVSGDTVVVGADAESSRARGVNGDDTNTGALASGAAYVFTGFKFGPRLALLPDGQGDMRVRASGKPNETYRLQRAPSVMGPWTTGASQTANSSGVVEFWDIFPPPGHAVYRTIQP